MNLRPWRWRWRWPCYRTTKIMNKISLIFKQFQNSFISYIFTFIALFVYTEKATLDTTTSVYFIRSKKVSPFCQFYSFFPYTILSVSRKGVNVLFYWRLMDTKSYYYVTHHFISSKYRVKIQLKPCKMFWELKIFLKEICFFLHGHGSATFSNKIVFCLCFLFCENSIICSFRNKSTLKLIWFHSKRVNGVQ